MINQAYVRHPSIPRNLSMVKDIVGIPFNIKVWVLYHDHRCTPHMLGPTSLTHNTILGHLRLTIVSKSYMETTTTTTTRPKHVIG